MEDNPPHPRGNDFDSEKEALSADVREALEELLGHSALQERDRRMNEEHNPARAQLASALKKL